jgi:hypothetical protein
MPKYFVVPDGLVEGYERYGREQEPPSTKNAYNGVRRTKKSATPDPKRPGLGSLYKQKTQTDSKKLTPLLEDRCCNCTKYSTCTTKRCECRMANKPCVSCVCLYQCKNQCVEIKTEGRFGETETKKARTETLSSPGVARRPTMPPSRPDIQPSAATKEANQAPTPAVDGTKGTERKEKEHEIRFDEDKHLPAYALTATDIKMDAVYGNHVHSNDGTHLTGGIIDNYVWQDYWRRLTVFPETFYNIPKGPTGKRFLGMLTKELSGIIDRKWNSERFIVFSIDILQRQPLVVRARDIKKRLEWRMDAWRDSKYSMLVQDTASEGAFLWGME